MIKVGTGLVRVVEITYAARRDNSEDFDPAAGSERFEARMILCGTLRKNLASIKITRTRKLLYRPGTAEARTAYERLVLARIT